MNDSKMRYKIDYHELDLVNRLISALDIDVDEKGLLSQSFIALTIPDCGSLKRLAIPIKDITIGETEVYFQPVNNNRHNKALISVFLRQYPAICDISFSGTDIVFFDANNKPVHIEKDTVSPKEGVCLAILNYINTV